MQSTVFSQVIKLIPRAHFQKIVSQYEGDRGVRRFNCWTWFGVLLFGQLTGQDSIRTIEQVFNHGTGLQVLGFTPIRRSTFADANRRRPLEILQETFFELLQRVQKQAPAHHFRIRSPILSLDASVIDLSLKLMPWARFDSIKASIKLHTAMDLRGDLPQVVVLEEGTQQDMKVTREQMSFEAGTLLIFDKGYSNYTWYQHLSKNGVSFVTRMKDFAKFKVIRSRKTDREKGYICDQEIYITGRHAGRARLGKLRRIVFRDPITKKKLIFLTNRLDLSIKTICDLYKARWKVELFFKTMKQNLKLKKFLGTTSHAVYAQIWVALIAYLLVQHLRFTNSTPISNPAVMAVLGTMIFAKAQLSRLLGQITSQHRANQEPPAGAG